MAARVGVFRSAAMDSSMNRHPPGADDWAPLGPPQTGERSLQEPILVTRDAGRAAGGAAEAAWTRTEAGASAGHVADVFAHSVPKPETHSSSAGSRKAG